MTPIGYVCFTTSRRKRHFFCLQPGMSKKITIIGLDERMEVLRRLDGVHRVESRAHVVEQPAGEAKRKLHVSKQTELSSWPSGIRAAS